MEDNYFDCLSKASISVTGINTILSKVSTETRWRKLGTILENDFGKFVVSQ